MINDGTIYKHDKVGAIIVNADKEVDIELVNPSILHNFNAKFSADESDIITPNKLIECRHLCTTLDEAARNSVEQGDDVHPAQMFSSENDLKKSVGNKPEARYNAAISGACGVHLISCSKFGHHLAEHCKVMEPSEHQRLLLVESGNHTMWTRVSHDPSLGIYLIQFYEPPRSNDFTIHRFSDLNELADHRFDLKSFVKDDTSYNSYFGASYFDDATEKECVVFDTTKLLDVKRSQFDSFCTDNKCGITGTMVFHSMRLGIPFTNEQIDLIKGLGLYLLKEVLEAKKHNGTPGLYMALQNGQSVSVDQFNHLLDLIPKNYMRDIDIVELIVAKRKDGEPGLLVGMRHGSSQAIVQYGVLLKRVPVKERVEILMAKDGLGVTGFHYLLRHYGTADTINAYKGLLSDLPKDALSKQYIEELLMAVDVSHKDKPPGIYFPIVSGKAEVLTAYINLVQHLCPHEEQRNAILKKLMSESNCILFSRALTKGHQQIIGPFFRLLMLASPPERQKIVNNLLKGIRKFEAGEYPRSNWKPVFQDIYKMLLTQHSALDAMQNIITPAKNRWSQTEQNLHTLHTASEELSRAVTMDDYSSAMDKLINNYEHRTAKRREDNSETNDPPETVKSAMVHRERTQALFDPNFPVKDLPL